MSSPDDTSSFLEEILQTADQYIYVYYLDVTLSVIF